jgi:tetratricopeptide (TPR) repeat protein
MVTAPLAVMLFDRMFLYRSATEAWRERRALYGWLGATWAVLAAAIWSGPRMYSAGFQAGVSPWTYLLNQAVMIGRYLRLAVWPSSLVLAYGDPQPLASADIWPYAALVIGLIAVTIVAVVRWPRLGFLGAWFFITLAPTSSIVPIATEVGAERRMYLPLAALVVLAVIGTALAFTRLKRLSNDRSAAPRYTVITGWLVLAVIATSLAVITIRRNREYASSLVMAETVLARWPTAFARTMVGVELAAAGRHDDAIRQLREAAASFPRARYHLGGELYNKGHYPEAIEQLQAFVRERPLLVEAVRARIMLGRAYLATGKPAEAIEQLRLVQSMTAESSDAYVTATGFLADALFAQQRCADAAPYYRAFLAARPQDVGGLTNYGICLANMGQHDEATTVFRRAAQLQPTDVLARSNLARALFNQGHVDEAAAEAAALIRQHPEYGGGHALLGRALASQGELTAARSEFERALQLDPNDQQTRADLDLVRRAARGKPNERGTRP